MRVSPSSIKSINSIITYFPFRFNPLIWESVFESIQKKEEGHPSSFCSYSASAFSTCVIADFCIGIRQFLLFPNSTITSSSEISISTP